MNFTFRKTVLAISFSLSMFSVNSLPTLALSLGYFDDNGSCICSINPDYPTIDDPMEFPYDGCRLFPQCRNPESDWINQPPEPESPLPVGCPWSVPFESCYPEIKQSE